MLYNQTKTAAGQAMPLLMGCTMPTPIEVETAEHKIIYDPLSQKVVIDMRTVGTKSLKSCYTKMSHINKMDQKNEIDDSKQV